MVRALAYKLLERRGVRQLIKFGMVGLANTFVDFGIYLTLTRVFDIYFLYANIAAVLVAMTVSFFANKTFTFKNRSTRYLHQYSRVAVINLIGFVINNTLLYLLISGLGLYDIFAKVGVIGVVFCWNFLMQKYWVFADEPSVKNDEGVV